MVKRNKELLEEHGEKRVKETAEDGWDELDDEEEIARIGKRMKDNFEAPPDAQHSELAQGANSKKKMYGVSMMPESRDKLEDEAEESGEGFKDSRGSEAAERRRAEQAEQQKRMGY